MSSNASKVLKPHIPALVVAFFTACGGGGSSNSITTPSPSSATRLLNESAFQNKVENYAVGDLNGDGLDDVVIGGWTGVAPGSDSYLAVLIQNANGSMTDRTDQLVGTHIYPGSNRIFILDVDNDGFVDIWLPGFNDCTGCSAQSVMLWGNANGIFTRQTFATAIDSHGAGVVDLNGDGRKDLLIRGVWDGTTNNYGYYLNNGNRTFTFVTNSQLNGAATCAVVKDLVSGHIAVVQGNNNQVAGFSHSINIFNDNLNLITRIGVVSQDLTVNDLINSISVDVNADGLMDFVLVFNPLAGAGGRREVWLNRGADNFSYAYTIESGQSNSYDIQALAYQGSNYYHFNAANGDANLYRLQGGQFLVYLRESFLSMARALGANPGVRDWSVWSSTVYRGSTGMYMLQHVTAGYYTQKL
ncbi:MAG: VCBS repeat-containing protein [Comamonadaceae bacterium]|nr:MAG: VCBS repeat-containing protein [Comamonadaceae bacterium]